jgi:hypothetical protein
VLACLALSGLVAAGCTSHAGTAGAASELAAPPKPIDIGYFFGSAHNPLIAVPPRPGQHPPVLSAAALRAIQRPDNWPLDAPRNDRIVFGYGRVTAPTATSTLGGRPFRRQRLAWLAIYRASTAAMEQPSCPVAPAVGNRRHLVHLAQRPTIRVAVIVDAGTGQEAIWTDLRNTCPHVVADVPRRDGRVVGRFIAVGGPLGAPSNPQRGVVSMRQQSTGRRINVVVGSGGRFDHALPPGRYTVTGHSPQFRIDGRDGLCNARHPIVVRPRRVTHSIVYCQRR